MLRSTTTLVFSFFSVLGTVFVLVYVGQGKQIFNAYEPTPYQWDIPYNIPPPLLHQKKHVVSEQSVRLGRHLFYDTNLSGNASTACASCHQQGFAFAQRLPVSIGSTGKPLKRNALPLINLAYASSFTWAHNGLDTIEQQMHLPLFNEFPEEMGITGYEEEVLIRFDTPTYNTLFLSAYGDTTVTFERIINAIGDFVRSLTSFNSAFDRYAYNNEDDALSADAIAGMNLFFSEKLECFHCHGGLNFTQASQHSSQSFKLKAFHNNGLNITDNDSGLHAVTRNESDRGKFKAPTLRNISHTAPYMHNGSLATLSDVIDFYASGGVGEGMHQATKSPFIKGFSITEKEKAQLIAFLNSLTDEQFLTNPSHSAPFAVPENPL